MSALLPADKKQKEAATQLHTMGHVASTKLSLLGDCSGQVKHRAVRHGTVRLSFRSFSVMAFSKSPMVSVSDVSRAESDTYPA